MKSASRWFHYTDLLHELILFRMPLSESECNLTVTKKRYCKSTAYRTRCNTLRICKHFYPLPSEFTSLLLRGSPVMRDSDATEKKILGTQIYDLQHVNHVI
jgi:hypothetical protein